MVFVFFIGLENLLFGYVEVDGQIELSLYVRDYLGQRGRDAFGEVGGEEEEEPGGGGAVIG